MQVVQGVGQRVGAVSHDHVGCVGSTGDHGVGQHGSLSGVLCSSQASDVGGDVSSGQGGDGQAVRGGIGQHGRVSGLQVVQGVGQGVGGGQRQVGCVCSAGNDGLGSSLGWSNTINSQFAEGDGGVTQLVPCRQGVGLCQGFGEREGLDGLGGVGGQCLDDILGLDHALAQVGQRVLTFGHSGCDGGVVDQRQCNLGVVELAGFDHLIKTGSQKTFLQCRQTGDTTVCQDLVQQIGTCNRCHDFFL